MILELQSPFKEKYRVGYLIDGYKNKDKTANKSFVVVFNTTTDKRTITYVRYLMSVKLGRIIEPHEKVGFKDGNKNNRHPDNLQLLSNIETGVIHQVVSACCTGCGNMFNMRLDRYKANLRIKQNNFCSQLCFNSNRTKTKQKQMGVKPTSMEDINKQLNNAKFSAYENTESEIGKLINLNFGSLASVLAISMGTVRTGICREEHTVKTNWVGGFPLSKDHFEYLCKTSTQEIPITN